MLSSDLLRELLTYNALTGKFSWRVRRKRVQPGDPAGSSNSEGYTYIKIAGKNYKASRLAWLYMRGELPSKQVDHKDRCRANDRWCNLQLTTHQHNQWNKSLNKNNKTGHRGVFYVDGKFRSALWINGRRIGLGCYRTAEEAHAAYKRAAKFYRRTT